MGYGLEAVIADAALVRATLADLPRARHVGLSQGLALVPLTDALHDDGPFREFHLLPGWPAARVRSKVPLPSPRTAGTPHRHRREWRANRKGRSG
ncbi:hypothetical protein [Nocardiopsis sp. JB363]|uniref:hypothetical protein n=1 Tax=Nocardiopsis sp. JB363 TaxID=1434837 RepID=UPI000979E05F|nr:hypothetical protein [Nocardiopsis sp. JB363]SIO85146.1 hypothetical protein BQ8420_05485 [Nocardiopsis sp. JB363]